MMTLGSCCGRFWLAWSLALLVACGEDPPTEDDGTIPVPATPAATDSFEAREQRFWFVEEAAARGLTGINHCGSTVKKRYLVEEIGQGATLFDADLDGRLDVFIADGCTLLEPGTDVDAPADQLPPSQPDDWLPAFDGRSRFYRNVGAGHFDDTTESSGIDYRGMASGAIAGDVDNDGDPDLALTAWGPNRFYRNRGDGTFVDESAAAGTTDPRWSVGSCFLDYDLDGNLDLYVANYFALTTARDPLIWQKVDCEHEDLRVACGPKTMVAEPDTLYRNRGDGSFEDVSESSGIRSVEPRYGLGVVAFDCDKDGDTDIYVANDSRGNFLLVNEGEDGFADWAELSGAALSANGTPQAGMGIGVGDYDNDNDLDVHLTNFSHDDNTLYRNDRRRLFQDVALQMRFGEAIYFALGWGTDFADFDHDGRLELFVANGHIYPEADQRAPELTYGQQNRLFGNDDGRLRDITDRAGPGLAEVASTRGAACGDVDGDGDLDLVLVQMNRAPSLLINHLVPAGGSLLVSVEGEASNRDGIGTKVLVSVDGCNLIQEVRSGHSFASGHDRRLHFGTGQADVIESMRVVWPGGERQEFRDVPARGWIHVRQGAEQWELRELVR